MAERSLVRFIRIVFDRASAKKTEAQMAKALEQAGKEGGRAFLRELRAAFDKRMAELKVQLAKGLIDKAEFRKQGDLAARTFNAGLVRGMEEARATGLLTDKVYLKLAGSLKRVGDAGTEATGALTGMFGRLGIGLGAAFGIRQVFDAVSNTVKAAIEAEDSVSRLESALKKLGLAYTDVGPEAERYLDRLQKTTRFSDEDAREALTTLVTITGDYAQSLRLLSLTADIAEKRQTTMADAAETAGKAALGLTRGMQDLGIRSGETGDVIQKLRDRFGGLAEEAGQKTGGRLKTLGNLFGEVTEKIGLAITGSDGFTRATEALRQQLIAVTEWLDKHGETISRWVSRLVDGSRFIATNIILAFRSVLDPAGAAGAMQKLWADILKGEEETQGALKDLTLRDQVERRQITQRERKLLNKIAAEGGAELIDLTKRDLAALHQLATDDADGRITLMEDERKAIEQIQKQERDRQRDRQRDLATELERLNREIQVRYFQLEAGFAEAAARQATASLERQRGFVRQFAATIDEAQEQLARLDVSVIAKALPDTIVPQVDQTETAFERIAFSAEASMAKVAKATKKVTDAGFKVADPYAKSFAQIEADVKNQIGLLVELSEAVAESGWQGLMEYAKGKVKQNLAWVIENIALAFNALGLGQPKAAAEHFTSAAKHGAAAAAWQALASGSGGMAGGGGGGGGAGTEAAGAEPAGANAGAATEPPGAEVTIVLNGPGFDALNPEVQRVVWGAQQQALERYGRNANVRIVRNNSRRG